MFNLRHTSMDIVEGRLKKILNVCIKVKSKVLVYYSVTPIERASHF